MTFVSPCWCYWSLHVQPSEIWIWISTSILGPLLFTPNTTPIQDIISAHNLDCMFDADYSQLYATVNPLGQLPALNTLLKCICHIITWNTNNMLVCNPGKIEVIHITPVHLLRLLSIGISCPLAIVVHDQEIHRQGCFNKRKQETRIE